MLPSRLAPIVLIASLLLAGCAATPAHDGAPAPSTGAAGPAPLHLRAAGTKTLLTTPGKLASEFWVSVHPTDPTLLAMGRLEFDPKTQVSPGLNGWRCVISVSRDGGHGWIDTQPLFPDGSSDPWVAWHENGTLQAICNTGNYARSPDGGVTWSKPGKVPTPGNDRPSIEVSDTGRLLYCATRPGTNEGPSIIFSDDAGSSWAPSDAHDVDDTWEQTICNHMAHGPDGTLYAGIGLSEFRLLVSGNDGESWRRGGRIQLNDPRRANYGSSVPTHEEGNMFPSFTVSPTTGHVFVGVQNFSQSQAGGVGGYHVELYRSSDRGASFERLSVPQAPAACRLCDTTRPVVHVDAFGRLGLLWRTNDLGLPFQTWFDVSVDEGTTWLEPLLLSTESATQGSWSPGSVDGADHYWSMASTPDGFLVLWIDRSEGGTSQVWSQFVGLSP